MDIYDALLKFGFLLLAPVVVTLFTWHIESS
jgi:hypothetical protein